MAAKYCKKCGTNLSPKNSFCPNCGEPRGQPRNIAPKTTQEVYVAPQAPTPPLTQSSSPPTPGQTSTAVSSGAGQVVTVPKGVLGRFTNEEQDPAVVADVHSKVSSILTYSEEILYIAVQKKLIPNVSPDCVVLTNKRFIKYTKKNVGLMGVKVPLTGRLGGAEFEDYNWRDLRDAHVKEGMRGATLTLKTTDDHTISVVLKLHKSTLVTWPLWRNIRTFVL